MNLLGSSKAAEKNHGEEEEDLTSLLTVDQSAEFTLLLAKVTGCMVEALEGTFDARQVEVDFPSKGNANIDESNSTSEQEEEDVHRQAREQREAELSVPRMQELKAAALDFLNTWRDSVTLRVGEAMNAHGARPGPDDHKSSHSTGIDSVEQHADDKAADLAVERTLHSLYPPVSTPLASLARDERMLILHSMLLLLLSLEHYTAHSRILLVRLCTSLHLPVSVLAEDETRVAQGLLETAKHMSGAAETQKRSDENQTARTWKVGLASVAGAALIGVTGGLAAPFVAAGVGGLLGGLGLGATAAAGYLGTLAGSGVLVGSLFGAYGGQMTGKMMDAYAREVEDFAFLPVHPPTRAPHSNSQASTHRLRITIGISGWLTDPSQVVQPWRVFSTSAETFALRYELDALLHIGNALTEMVKSTAWGYAKTEIIRRTIFASINAALWPLGLLKISRIVDNPFSVAMNRSDKAGAVLADALINRAQGKRPVSLVGYSLGARVIYRCVMCLAARRAFGLLENVVLLGAPCPSSSADWRVMRSVVAGRLVNVYSEKDYILGFLYRTSSVQFGVAGLQRVLGVAGVENEDASEVVSGHLRYRNLVGSLLKGIGLDDLDLEEVESEERTLSLVMGEDAEEEEKAVEEPAGAKKVESLCAGLETQTVHDDGRGERE